MTDVKRSLKQLELAELARLAEAATPGPWKIGAPPPNGTSTVGTLRGLMTAHCFTDDNSAFIAAANPQAVLGLIARIESLEKHLALALSFAPNGPVPEGLTPMFYHTLEYHSEVELQKRIDEAREALKEGT